MAIVVRKRLIAGLRVGLQRLQYNARLAFRRGGGLVRGHSRDIGRMRLTAMRQSLRRRARRGGKCEETSEQERAAKHQQFKPEF